MHSQKTCLAITTPMPFDNLSEESSRFEDSDKSEESEDILIKESYRANGVRLVRGELVEP